MVTLRQFIIVITIIAVAGCASVTITHDYDHEADFNKYKTYDWLPTESSATGPGMFLKNVRHALQRELELKGITPNTNKPDMLIAMHLGKEAVVQVVDSGYMYGRRGTWTGARDIHVMRYDEGTLIIDFIDAESKELVWRGSATGVINPYIEADKRREKIDKGMKEMMANYPPK